MAANRRFARIMSIRDWRVYQKILLGILLLLAGLALYAFLPVREDLSYLAGSGDGYDVRILRDSWGVPHIFGVRDADTAYGLAYAHAEDDFLTIQQAFLAARGHLASVYGVDAAPNDYMVHLLRVWDTIDARYDDDISPEMHHMLDAYADGLNHFAALHQDETLPGLFPVNGRDIAAGFIHKIPLFYGLDGVLGELFAAERQQPVSAQSDPTAFLLPDGINQYGSNTFSIAPSRTANGETLFAVNTHQPWEGLATWYEAHTHSEEGLDVVGGLFPGAPTIALGHNRNLGWSFTVNSPDLVDVYVLDINPDNPDQYRFDGEWRDLEVRQSPIKVKLLGRISWTVKRETLWSVYGPTVRQDHGTYAIRYAGIGEVSFVEQFYHLSKASNLEQWQQAMREGSVPMFNTGYADKEGNIYYVYNAKLPIRSQQYDWSVYLPGDSSDTLWTEYLPFDQLPQVLNPSSGFVQNSNSSPFQTTMGNGNPEEADYPATFGIETQMSNRALRSLELFGSDGAITESAFQTYKYDMTYSEASDMPVFVSAILANQTATDAAAVEAAELLADWDLVASPESQGATIALLTLHFAIDGQGVEINGSKLTESVMPTTVLMDSFREAIDYLLEHYGSVNVAWGDVNRLRRGEVDLAVGGGADLLHATYGTLQEDGRIRINTGDCYIMLVSWDADGQLNSQSIHQYGSSTLDQTSHHYADQSPLFASRQLKPVWMEESEIRDHLEMEYRPGEELD